MLANCATSCHTVEQQELLDAKELQGIQSFFDLGAHDIHGNWLSFDKFKGQVTIIVNVASYCGYTDSHYKQLVQLSTQVKQYTGKVHILAVRTTIAIFLCVFSASVPSSHSLHDAPSFLAINLVVKSQIPMTKFIILLWNTVLTFK